MCGGSASTGQRYSGRRGSCCATRSVAFGDDCSSYRIPGSRRGHGQRRPRRRPRARGGRLFRVRVRPARRRARAAGRLRHAPRRRRAAAADAPRRGPHRATPRASASRSRSRPTPAPTRASRASTACDEERFESLLAVPILDRSERLAGAMNVRTAQPREWHDDEVELLETIASQVAQAIENATPVRPVAPAGDRARGAGPHLRGRLAVAVRVGDAGRDRRHRPRRRARERPARSCSSRRTACHVAQRDGDADGGDDAPDRARRHVRRPTRRARWRCRWCGRRGTIGALVCLRPGAVHDARSARCSGRSPTRRRRPSSPAAA